MKGTMAARWSTGLVVAWALGGCAVGSGPALTSQAFDGGVTPASTSGGSTGSITTGGQGPMESGAEDPDSSGPPVTDTGECNGNEDCVMSPGTCLETQGHCEAGVCEHGAAEPGVSCDDGDPCTRSDACDGEGSCFGVDLDCGNGECVDGKCIDEGCPAGFADCNGQMGDGCEVELGTDSNCAGCDDACVAGDNATGACTAGACDYQCTAPWENCDGDWVNGCEIPVGVAHQCDDQGINLSTGCWTAYCGNSVDVEATNFGTFHCIHCSTCRSPVAGQCQWCDSNTGIFFPTETCGCGAFEDLACVES